MSFLRKLTQEGWWDRSKRKESSVGVDKFSKENLKDLVTKRTTIVVDQDSGKSFSVTIKDGVSIDHLSNDDFEIVEVPNIAARAKRSAKSVREIDP